MLTFLLTIIIQIIDKNVHVTNVCPGPVKTAVAENALLSDGSTNNKKDPLIEGGMTVQRSTQCVHLYNNHMDILGIENIVHLSLCQINN